MMRTHTCGELRIEHLAKQVRLAGWVRFSRDHGGVLFFDLADAYGTTQVVFDAEAMEKSADLERLGKMLETIGRESVLSVTGLVRNRVPGTEDQRNPTGDVEVLIQEVQLLNRSKPLPFEVAEQKNSVLPAEEIRLRFRYLDLRRTQMANNIRFRHQVVSAARRYLDSAGFVDIETPTLIRSSPEGARDFIVPSRIFPGSFYALPQSPQLFKQMLMVAGMDKYYQLARCFRDEDSRSDRQPEFTQLDLEMSFVSERDVQATIENVLVAIWKAVYDKELKIPFPRICYHDAMNRYGSDAPDIRFGLELNNVTEIVKASSYDIFHRVIGKGGIVVCICVKAAMMKSAVADETSVGRNEVDRLIDWAKSQGMGGLTWMRMTNEGLSSNVVKYFPKNVTDEIAKAVGAEEGDLLLFLASSKIAALKAGGELRKKLARDLNLLEGKDHQFVWLVDCPLFGKDPLTGQIEAFHHMFVKPVGGDIPEGVDMLTIGGLSYDLTMNGSEIGSGSVRCHDPAVQRKIFKLMGMSDEKIDNDFSYFLEALGYGAPPHGGIALGVDRLVALMLGCESIREVIAFPKNKKFQSLTDGSPAPVDEARLTELQLLCLNEEKED